MINKLWLLGIGIVAFVPIFYVALCFYMGLDFLSSFHIIGDVWNGLQAGREFKSEVWLSLAWASILPVLSLFLLIQSRRSTSYGRARFAKESDLKKMGLNLKKGFALANFKGNPLCFDNGLSALIVAAPGTGKTSAIAVPNLLSIPTSCIVLDIKGELEALTADYRAKELGNEVYVFDPFGSKNTFYFNPFGKEILSKLSFDETLSTCKQFANIFIPSNAKDNDVTNHFKGKARSLFVLFAMYDITKRGETSFNDINRFPKRSAEELLNDDWLVKLLDLQKEGVLVDELNYFFKQAAEDEELDPLLRDQARSMSRITFKEMSSIISTLSNEEGGLGVMNDYRLIETTSKMSFSYEDLRKKNITVYITVKEKDVKTLAPIIRVFYEAIGKNLLDKENNNPSERVYFINDEFTRFGKLEFLLELPALSRSYNIPGIYITQTEAQIEKYYSKEDLRIVAGSVAYRAYFAINDNETAKRVSEEVGDFTRDKVSESSQANKFLGSKNKSHEGYKLLTSQDLMNLRKDEILILALGGRGTPIKAKANYYFKNRKFKKIIKKYGRKEI